MSFPYDRRLCPRAAIQWPIGIETSEGPISAKLKDLGADGAYIYCDRALKPRDFVAIRIDPPNHPSLKITAEVVWTDRLSPLGIGVRFVQMSEKHRHFLFNEVSGLLESDHE
jgi:hypothetical protein